MYLMYYMYMKDITADDGRIPVHVARRTLADLINRVLYTRERIRLGRRGKTVAVIISIEDADLLEALEDRADLEAGLKALAEARGKKTIPWKQIKKELGL